MGAVGGGEKTWAADVDAGSLLKSVRSRTAQTVGVGGSIASSTNAIALLALLCAAVAVRPVGASSHARARPCIKETKIKTRTARTRRGIPRARNTRAMAGQACVTGAVQKKASVAFRANAVRTVAVHAILRAAEAAVKKIVT